MDYDIEDRFRTRRRRTDSRDRERRLSSQYDERDYYDKQIRLDVPSSISSHRRSASANDERDTNFSSRRTRSSERQQERHGRSNTLIDLKSAFDDCMDALEELEEVCRKRADTSTSDTARANFRRIADTAEDQQFRLKVWEMESQVSKAMRVESRGTDIVSNIRNSLLVMDDSTLELAKTCKKIPSSEMARRWETLDDTSDTNGAQKAALIKSNLATNESIVRNVSFLADSAVEVLELPVEKKTPKRKEELLVAGTLGSASLKLEEMSKRREKEKITEDGPTQALIEDLIIQDVVEYFGSADKVRKYPISQQLEGADALREAKRRFGGDQRKDKIELEYRLEEDRRRSRYEVPYERLRPVRETPTYIKVSRSHLDPETLDYYDVRYEDDKYDPGNIIILEELDQKDTDVLFEHTRRRRASTRGPQILVHESDTPTEKYAFVRRAKSHSYKENPRRSEPSFIRDQMRERYS